MKPKPKRRAGLSAAAKTCLSILLDAELSGAPVEFHTWRAKNAKKIPLLDELKRHRMIEGDTHCVVTFWGLMNAPGDRAVAALARCGRIFRALRKFYPEHPKEQLTGEALAKLARMSPVEARQSAQFLSRSLVFLSISSHESDMRISPNEQYVTLKGFDELKDRTREGNRRPIEAQLFQSHVMVATERELLRALGGAESEAVRACWQKMQERMPSDPEGAITAARSLIEAACKYVLEEFGDTGADTSELPRLYRKAAEVLRLDSRVDIDESLRRVLAACAAIVDGVAHLRNRLSDAHGKDRRSAKPARRHAEFVVLISAAMTGLLLSTLDAQRTP